MPVLVPDLGNYLRGSYLHLRRLIEDQSLVSRAMLGWLRQQMLNTLSTKDEQMLTPQPSDDPAAAILADKWTGAYVWAHYHRNLPPDEATPVVQQMLDSLENQNPHRLLDAMIGRHLTGGRRLAVDVGCSVGGFTARLACRFDFTIGIDLSFDKLLQARRLLLHEPEAPTGYRYYQEGNRWEERALRVPAVSNIDFVLASALRLPISTESCDAVASVNVLDIVDDPHVMLDEMQRVLRRAGIALLASPYLDINRAVTHYLAKKSPPATTVRQKLSVACEVVEEVDDVPWVIRNARRRYQLFLDHCVAALKL
jgi:SAM-dependent methyltransferase